VVQPLVSYLSVGRCKDEATLSIVPILFTVLPGLRFYTFFIVSAEFLINDFCSSLQK